MTKFYDDETKLDFSDVLIVPGSHLTEAEYNAYAKQARPIDQISSRNDVKLLLKHNYMNQSQRIRLPDIPGEKIQGIGRSGILECVPLIAANMDGVGTLEMHEQLSKNAMMTALKKDITDEELDSIADTSLAFLTIGMRESELDRLEDYKDKFTNICIDVPNGYLETFPGFVSRVRNIVGENSFIMAGNVVTSEQALAIYLAGANCVKVGIGPGSVCTTRIKTGIGFPQLSAILEISKQARTINASKSQKPMYICSDGGCTNPGDIAKAYAAGAHFVMLGGMLAGHDEGGGEIVTKYEESNERMMHPEGKGWVPVIDEKKNVQFYGMSSKTANEKHNGGLKGYRTAEGKEVLIPYKGPVQNTIDDILGGIRSACTYLGAESLQKLTKKAKFIKVNNQVNNVFK